MKFIHCADIHLDSPLRGLERYEGAPVAQIRGAVRQAFIQMIDLCLQEEVAFLLIAGDLYDGDWLDFSTGLFFVQQMKRLDRVSIPVYVVRGNHDAASQMTKSLPFPSNVFIFPVDKPKTIRLESCRVAIHGHSYRSEAVRDNLAAGYPAPVQGYFNIGLLHTGLDGRSGHAPYAPCTLADLTAREYDYWALGHIHQRALISSDPVVLFPGNIQGRHIRETGAKGCTLVTVMDGRVTEMGHQSVDVVRWVLLEVDLTGVATLEEVGRLVREALIREVDQVGDRLLVVRLRLLGRCQAHALLWGEERGLVAHFRALALDVGTIWLEKLERATAMPGVVGRSIDGWVRIQRHWLVFVLKWNHC
ncbi:MAG: DNA repair exonuclease [Magnetococcus sp. DMHC-6]